jgi:hypothetical protein
VVITFSVCSLLYRDEGALAEFSSQSRSGAVPITGEHQPREANLLVSAFEEIAGLRAGVERKF